jgi:hypothetical protein
VVAQLAIRASALDAAIAGNASALSAVLLGTQAALAGNISALNRSISDAQAASSGAQSRVDVMTSITTNTALTFTSGNGAQNVGPTNTFNARNVRMAGTPAGVQLWTVPATGPYTFVLAGAPGGSTSIPDSGKGILQFDGGAGRIGSATLNLTRGQTVGVLVGQAGTSGGWNGGGGGGGSLVFDYTTMTVLLAAGGGGGSPSYFMSPNTWSFSFVTSPGGNGQDNAPGGAAAGIPAGDSSGAQSGSLSGAGGSGAHSLTADNLNFRSGGGGGGAFGFSAGAASPAPSFAGGLPGSGSGAGGFGGGGGGGGCDNLVSSYGGYYCAAGGGGGGGFSGGDGGNSGQGGNFAPGTRQTPGSATPVAHMLKAEVSMSCHKSRDSHTPGSGGYGYALSYTQPPAGYNAAGNGWVSVAADALAVYT